MNNFKRVFYGTGNITAPEYINYLRILLHGGALREFDELARHNTGTNHSHLNFIQEGLLGVGGGQLTPFPIRSAWWAVQCTNLDTSISSALPPVSQNSTTNSLFFPDPAPPVIYPPKNLTRYSYTASGAAGQNRHIYKSGGWIWRATKLLANYLK